ncbi:tryptophan dimethylallyltransferase family protein [Streptomyces sp. NPDC058739]|uniref:tryptophan dimethylallyltransferase family protein n=1 Tax=Streptomyces sp. NPDC058739 TaxID=3346618 RepID=UPI0036AC44ED
MTRRHNSLAAPVLGDFASGQLMRLCDIVGLSPADAVTYANVLTDALGPVAARPLDEPPPYASFLSDDHTPVEYSLSFRPGSAPMLRVLLEPGCAEDSLARNGSTGLRVVREMARRWDFATDALDEVEDLFFPADPQGPLALWCALELGPGGVPRVKVYLNPAASGPKRSFATLREAMGRLGHAEAFAALPPAHGYPFLALDLGDWDTPRVKVYLRHDGLSAARAATMSRMRGEGPEPTSLTRFFRIVAGLDIDGGQDVVPLVGRPVLTCHAFTKSTAGLPSGFTLHIPVRDYVRHDGEALDRGTAVLRDLGVDTSALLVSTAAITPRRLQDGVGLIAYLAVAHQEGSTPRVTAYLSSEAYTVRAPVAGPLRQAPVVVH